MAFKDGSLVHESQYSIWIHRKLRHSNSCKKMKNYVSMLISSNSILETQRGLKTDTEAESKQLVSTVQRCLSGQSKSAHGINLRFEFSNSWLLSNTIIWHTIPKSKLSLSISPWITKWSSELSFISMFPSKSWRHQHIQLNRLLINITYSRGPKIENCGTPDLTGKAPDFTPPITTDCCRPWSYDLMNRIISPFIPN